MRFILKGDDVTTRESWLTTLEYGRAQTRIVVMECGGYDFDHVVLVSR